MTAIRADRAYAQLELEHGAGTEPGSGQTVGLIDTGIDTGHDVFAGKTVSEHFFSGATDETGDRTSHGTAVASVIVGRPSDAFTASVTAGRGVARGADVAMFAIRAGSSSGNYVPISLAGLNGARGAGVPGIIGLSYPHYGLHRMATCKPISGVARCMPSSSVTAISSVVRSVSLNAPPRPIMTLGSASGATWEAL